MVMANATGLYRGLLSLVLLASLLCFSWGHQDEVAEAGSFSKCPKGQIFKNGVCMCRSGFTQCGSRCQNLQRDATSCGRCGKVCETFRFQTCLAGRCASKKCGARPGFIQCPTTIGGKTFAKTCYNSQTDPNHCGGCNRRCQQGSSCVKGACQALGVQCGGLVFAKGNPGVEQFTGANEGTGGSEPTNTFTIKFSSSSKPPAAQSVICGLTTTPATATSWNASKSRGQQMGRIDECSYMLQST